jgi:protein-serine/threonine kinase
VYQCISDFEVCKVLTRVSTASHASIEEEDIPTPQTPVSPGLGKKISLAMLKGQVDPTVVHRANLKPNRPVVISIDKEVVDPARIDNVPGSAPTSPSTSAGDSISTGRKSSAPGPSTGKTSLDSKWSSKHNVMSNSAQSSENKKSVGKHTVGDGGVNENILSSIAETESYATETPTPSEYLCKCFVGFYINSLLAIVTVEKAAAAKIFLECHYNDVTCSLMTSRSIRRRQLECALYEDTTSSEAEKNHKRFALAQMETDHLRETRVMKTLGIKALAGQDVIASKYEVVKVLGKGSFGVVRLVREKSETEWVKPNYGPSLD